MVSVEYTQYNHLETLLIEAEIIDLKQLKEALAYQSEDFKKGKRGLLGEILIDLGYVTEDQIGQVVARNAGVEYISLDNYPIDENALSLVPAEVVRRYQALPIGFDEGRLLVAMMYPQDVIAMDDLRLLTGWDIKPVMVADSELRASIEQVNRVSSDVEHPEEDQEDQEEIGAPQVAGDAVLQPAVKMTNLIFYQAVSSRASDIHIEGQEKGMRVRYRIDGVLHEVMRPPRKLFSSLVSRIKILSHLDIAERRIPQDGRMSIKVEGKTIDVRVASLPAAHGEKLTLRLLDRSSQLFSLDQLNIPLQDLEKMKQVIKRPYGFILITGPTGSGKSTTLYAALSQLNSVEKHIITVEDPIEYRIDGINQVQINPRAGLTFATGLRAILRNDPDIVMVGEIRDHETARIAVESALTGHLVLSTLHTNDAAGAVTRLGDMGIETYLTASALVASIGQRLMRVLCPHCKIPYEIQRPDLERDVPAFPFTGAEKTIILFRAGSCMRCSNTGYRGRVGVYEIMVINETIQRLILERRSTQEIKKVAVEQGMVTFFQNALIKARNGETTLEEVFRVVT